MKKYINYIVFLIIISCKAQSPVLDITAPQEGPKGAYYKDLYGVLDGYDGTYLYTNGKTSFKLILKKKIKSYGYYYEDLVVGEFQFIENGVEIGNTLSKMSVNYTDEYLNHSITGSIVYTGPDQSCPDCSTTEKRLRLDYADKKARSIAGIIVRKTTVNGKVAIRVKVWWDGFVIRKEGDIAPMPGSIRAGEYVMIKQ